MAWSAPTSRRASTALRLAGETTRLLAVPRVLASSWISSIESFDWAASTRSPEAPAASKAIAGPQTGAAAARTDFRNMDGSALFDREQSFRCDHGPILAQS